MPGIVMMAGVSRGGFTVLLLLATSRPALGLDTVEQSKSETEALIPAVTLDRGFQQAMAALQTLRGEAVKQNDFLQSQNVRLRADDGKMRVAFFAQQAQFKHLQEASQKLVKEYRELQQKNRELADENQQLKKDKNGLHAELHKVQEAMGFGGTVSPQQAPPAPQPAPQLSAIFDAEGSSQNMATLPPPPQDLDVPEKLDMLAPPSSAAPGLDAVIAAPAQQALPPLSAAVDEQQQQQQIPEELALPLMSQAPQAPTAPVVSSKRSQKAVAKAPVRSGARKPAPQGEQQQRPKSHSSRKAPPFTRKPARSAPVVPALRERLAASPNRRPAAAALAAAPHSFASAAPAKNKPKVPPSPAAPPMDKDLAKLVADAGLDVENPDAASSEASASSSGVSSEQAAGGGDAMDEEGVTEADDQVLQMAKEAGFLPVNA